MKKTQLRNNYEDPKNRIRKHQFPARQTRN